jgi:polygalacturonase
MATAAVATVPLLTGHQSTVRAVSDARPVAATRAVTAAQVVAAGANGGGHAAVTVATGDPRNVTEPRVPGGVCATVAAHLTISGRTFPSSQESSPPDTAPIQRALDSCAGKGEAVKLVAGSGNALLSGPLTVHGGEVLLVDSPVTLYGSRNPAGYQVSGAPACGTLSSSKGGCQPLIHVSGAGAGVEGVRDSAGHQGTIDGRGDTQILGTSTTWWQLAAQAKSSGKNQQNPRLMQIDGSDDFTLYDINLTNAANFHVVYHNGTGFTAWGVRIKTPANARNTDGIDPAGAKDVTIADSYIQDGDDGVAVKGSSAAADMTIRDNYFYGTHGISIGSETNGGVTNILFENNTLTGTDSSGLASISSNGIRIKSSPANGGKVTDVSYLNTCLNAVKGPIVLDTRYSGGSGSSIPSFTGIYINGVKAQNSPSGATSVFDGYSSSLPLGLTMENISLDVPKSTAEYANIQLANSNVTPSGTGVSVTNISGTGSVPSCTFPAFPGL